MLSFAGDQWDSEMDLPDGTKLEWRRVRSLLVDFFRGPAVKTVRRTGLELMHSFTLTKGKRIPLLVPRLKNKSLKIIKHAS